MSKHVGTHATGKMLMAESQIKLYYKNVIAEVIGGEHGITSAQLKAPAQKTSPLIAELNEERKAG